MIDVTEGNGCLNLLTACQDSFQVFRVREYTLEYKLK